MDTFHAQLTQMRPLLMRTARTRLRNPSWAEDAVSETLLAALQKRPDFTEPTRVQAWLFGILRHKVVDQLRQHLGDSGIAFVEEELEGEASEASDPCPRADPMRRTADSQFIAALFVQLERLPPMHAKAFVLRECQNSDTEEICDELAISEGALWVVLHRARRRLRQGLAKYAA